MKNTLDTEMEILEAFSASSVMDVTELRTLYYGRLSIFVSFTDDGMLSLDNDNDDLPAGYVSYDVQDVVARKVKTSEFYANVFRVKTEKKIKDVKMYGSSELKKDMVKLKELPYVGEEEIEIIESNMDTSILRSQFQYLFNLTEKIAANKGAYKKKYWRRILLDLGYEVISDPTGSGIIGKRNTPTTLILTKDIEEFDIVPIQKHKKDPRKRVVNQINRYVKKLATARNRVAKKKFMTRDEQRKDSITSKIFNKAKELQSFAEFL